MSVPLSLLMLALTLVKFINVSDALGDTKINVRPEEPIEGTEIEMSCGLDSIGVMSISINIVKPGSREYIQWKTGTNETTKTGVWSEWKDLKVIRPANKKSLIVKFLARPILNGLNFQCMAVDESLVYYQSFYTMKVKSPPKVLALSIDPKSDGTVGDKIMSNESRTVRCRLLTGTDENRITLTAPGKGARTYSDLPPGSRQVNTGTPKNYKEIILDRIWSIKDNGRKIICSVENDAGTATKTLRLNITYGTRQTTLSVSKGDNVTVGNEISCKSDGNPVPFVQITVSGYSEKDAFWASKGATGSGRAYLFIPHKASLGRYTISCNASNPLKSEMVKAVTINVVAASVTVKPSEAPSYASAGVIGGIILGLLVLVILVAIICFVVQRRQNETAKQERPMTHPVLMFKSGGQGGSHPGDRNQQATDLFVPSTGGSNGKQQFPERGDESIDDETALTEHPLNYASLEFDETPRSRLPIVFKDSEKVEYSEIMSTPNYNNTYDDEHYYENVRHNVV